MSIALLLLLVFALPKYRPSKLCQLAMTTVAPSLAAAASQGAVRVQDIVAEHDAGFPIDDAVKEGINCAS